MGTHKCCEEVHLFEAREVSTRWWPSSPQCLIVAESPGTPRRKYFYDPLPEYGWDPVEVRRYLLGSLTKAKLIAEPTLPAFRDAGFLLDHAIRCQLRKWVIDIERSLAEEYMSDLAARAHHLKPIIEQFSKVWIMGYTARNAVNNLYPEEVIMRFKKKLFPPYQESKKFFVSPYVKHYRTFGPDDIITHVKQFI